MNEKTPAATLPYCYKPAIEAAAAQHGSSYPSTLHEYASWLLGQPVLINGQEMLPEAFRLVDGGVEFSARHLACGTLSPTRFRVASLSELPQTRLYDWLLA